MSQKYSRRTALRNGLMSLGGMVLAPHFSMGAFPEVPLEVDNQNRIIYSPFVKEHFIPNTFAPVVAKLNANENPYGPSEKVIQAISQVAKDANRYAWKEMGELITKITKKEDVKPENVMMGPGSSDLLEKVGLVLFMKGGNIVSADPSYMSLMSVAQAVGATWKPVPCKADHSHDLDAMEKAIDKDTKLVYICNPNNPTGAITETKKLKDFCRRVSAKVPVFIDEAYIELAEPGAAESMVSLINENKNIIVARTFSKVMGMAGLRVGYMLATPSFLKDINKITRGGMGITLTSIAAANAAIDDQEFQKKTIRLNAETKQYTYNELTRLGYSYIPSHTNFILFPIKKDGKEFLKLMTEKGVGVRSFDIQNQTYCRVTLGTMDEMKIFVRSLSEIS